jgi:HNH endonuclease
MGQQQFEAWIKKEQPLTKTSQRHPKTIGIISNHLKKKGVNNYDLYMVNDAHQAKKLKSIYFAIDEYNDLNMRGNNMYSSAFNLYIKYLEALETDTKPDLIALDIQHIIEQPNIENTEKTSLIQSRIGQGKFRDSLIKLWGGCSVTGCTQITLLVASHIKPWNISSNQERLDPYNGFLLLPNLDKAFEQGFVSFDITGRILISNELPEYKLLGISSEMKISIQEQHKSYLEHHHSHVYKNS